MSAAKFSKGSWRIDIGRRGGALRSAAGGASSASGAVKTASHEAANILAADGRIVVSLRVGKTTRERDLADAALIAAAPDLYEAARDCEALLRSVTPEGEYAGMFAAMLARVTAAIAKAEGSHGP